jgi:uncharacterized protein YjbI with pentapeptide repeats
MPIEAAELISELQRVAPAQDGRRYLAMVGFRGADLRELELDGGQFGNGVVFGTPDERPLSMAGLDLSEAKLTNCHFRHVDLSGAKLSDAQLKDCSFTHVDMGKADLDRCKMRMCELEHVDLQGARLDNADLAGEKDVDFANGVLFKHVRFGVSREPGNPEPASCKRTSMRGDSFVECRFNYVLFDEADLRLCSLERCDFRYAQFRNTTLQGTQMAWCDLYRSFFDSGTVFAPKELNGISLTRAWVAGIVDLRSKAFREAGAAALIQEQDECTYYAFLHRTLEERPDNPVGAVEDRFSDAAMVYRRLAGVWQGQGAYSDAAWAYVHSRRLERRDNSPLRARFKPEDCWLNTPAGDDGEERLKALAKSTHPRPRPRLPVIEKDRWSSARKRQTSLREARAELGKSALFSWLAKTLKWAVLMAADALCSFGESLYRVFFWLIAIAAVPGIVYALSGGVREKLDGQSILSGAHGESLVQHFRRTRDLGNCLLLSISQMANSSPDKLRAPTGAAEVVGITQTLLGIALLGLLGFVLGNKLRNS